MSQLVATVIGALIAAAALYITSGPALGPARSRKALRELLEIRKPLAESDTAGREEINVALTKEFELLARLGDTSKQFAVTAATALGVLVVIAWLTMFVPPLMIEEGQKEVMRYISAGAFLLAVVPLFTVVNFAYERASSWRGKLAALIIGPIALVVLSGAAFIVVQETTYYRQLSAL